MGARVFIDGEAGTTGLQIKQRLESRTDIELLSIAPAARKDAGERKRLLQAADVAILCLPDDAAREAVALVADGNTRIIDASTAHRTDGQWTYGFPEMEPGHDATIANARFVANPGCYPTGAIALLRPLLSNGIMPPDYPVNVHAISGYSGGGRKLIEQFEDPTVSEPIRDTFYLYGLSLAHKHLPELTLHSGLTERPLFAPSVGSFKQGMMVQIGVHTSSLRGGAVPQDVHRTLEDWFAPGGHVSVRPFNEVPENGRLDPERLNGTNDMELRVFADPQGDQCLLVATLDNLGKGASGAAVQNLNLMLGLEPSLGLDRPVAA